MTAKTIIIGYGNIDRADDGAAFAVINELRRQLGVRILEEGYTGLDDLNNNSDSIFIPQLIPEIMEMVTGYDKIVFVDAHVSSDMEDLNCTPVLPEYSSSSFTHHMKPSLLIAYLKAMYQCEPEAHLVSVRGYEFDFRRTLSCQVQAAVRPAVDIILRLMDR
jgi:hydrogenase maturation protease